MPAKGDRTGEGQEPVACKKGHLNDPYPEDGRCVECGIWLPGNPFKSVLGDDTLVKQRDLHKEGILKRAKKYVAQENVEWNEINAITQDLAIRAATTKDRHDMVLLLEQLGEKKARPKSSDDPVASEFSVVVTGETVRHIQESLDELDALSRD